MTNARFTTTQTIGPFFHDGLQWGIALSKEPGTTASLVRIGGTVFDGNGDPIVDAMVECWAAEGVNAEAGALTPGFRRADTTDNGRFTLSIPASQGGSGAPAAYVTVFARGLLKHSFTAVFLEDDPGLANAAVLNQVPAERRATLIAKKVAQGEYRWDIRLQGENETVIFDFA